MFKNPWFTLVIGLMVGLALGYIFAEQQPIPPGKALRMGLPQTAGGGDGLPNGHPPIGDQAEGAEVQRFQQQIGEIQGLMAQSPDDVGLKVAMGDAYFELARVTGTQKNWLEARGWYEQAMDQGRANDPDVLTDLAVVMRNLQQLDRSLELLDRAIAVEPDHWQAWFNKVVIMNFDLHDHEGAREAFRQLKRLADENPEIPDLSQIEQEVMGS